MNYKRLLLSFVFAMLTISLTACGGGNNTTASTGNNNGGATPGSSNTGGTSGMGTPGGTTGGITGGTTGGTGSGSTGGGTGGGSTGGGTTTGGLYVYTVSGSNLAGFKFSADNRSFTQLTGLSSASPLNNTTIATTPSGEFLYTFQNSCSGITACSKAYDNTLYVQTVGSDGSLTQPRLPFPALTQPIQVLASPASKYAFVLSGPNTNTVSVFPIQEDGTFGTQAGSVAIPHITPDPTFGGATYTFLAGFTQTGGSYLWVTQNDVDRSGNTPKLVSIQYDPSSGAVIGTKTTPFSTIGDFEAAAIVGDTLVSSEAGMFTTISAGLTTSQLANGTATLAQHCSTSACTGVVQLVAHPSQRWVFGARSSGTAIQIQAYSIGTDGSITPVGNAISYPAATLVHMTVNSTGKYLFVTRNGDSQITALAIDQTTGGLSEITSTAVAAPGAVASSTL